MLVGSLSVQTGTIVDFNQDGSISVQVDEADLPVRSHFLRTSGEALPVLNAGDVVLVALNAQGSTGYVLGAVAPYRPQDKSDPSAAAEDGYRMREEPDESRHRTPTSDTVEVEIPPTAKKVRVRAAHIHLEAGEECKITCGGGTILIDRRGKIVIRGTEILSRARGSTKIKGASVAIN